MARRLEPSGSPPRACILYVEDDFRVAARVEEMLLRAGYVVSLAATSEAALILCENHRFDLIITDLFVFENGVLSGGGGHAFIRRLRNVLGAKRHAWWRDVPILAVSGGLAATYGIDGDGRKPLEHALAAGATDTLEKSDLEAELLSKVESLLSGVDPV